MRMLFVSPSGALGGAEHSLLLLVAALRERGVDVVVALFADGPLRQRLAALGARTVLVSPPAPVRRAGRYAGPDMWSSVVAGVTAIPTVLRIAQLARHVSADVVHTNGTKAHIIGGLAARLARVPVVWHVHDFPPSGWPGRIFRMATRLLPAAILVNSQAVGAAIERIGATAPIVTVYNPIDVDAFHPGISRDRVRRSLGVSEDVPVIGLVAHLTPWKGHDVFLEMAAALADSPRRPRFVVAGGPVYETNGHAGYAEALRARAIDLGLSERVAFLGARDDIAQILAGLDVLVHTPTAPEPFGRVLAEAMAVGRPVVASRCGGIPEVIEDQVTGLLVPPGDVAEITSAVARLLEDPELRAALGQQGRRRAERLFGVDTHVDKVVGVYRDIIDRRRGGA